MSVEILLIEMLPKLTAVDCDQAENFDHKLIQKLEEVQPLIQNVVDIQNENIRFKYLQTLVSILRIVVKENVISDNEPFSVKQIHSMQVAMAWIVSIGIIPCLEIGSANVARLCPKAVKIPYEGLACIEKYKRLKYTTIALIDMFNNKILQPIILLYFGTFMAALLQMSYAPLVKPTSENNAVKNLSKDEFRMTVRQYQQFQCHQKEFYVRFVSLLSICPQYKCIQTLMLIHGQPGAPKWLRTCTRNLLIHKTTQPGGVISLISAVCGNDIDIGANWNTLDLISRLLTVTSHGQDADEYYRLVCPQILELFHSNKIKHASAIANCCITFLYRCNPSACEKHIVNAMCAPLVMTESFVPKLEREMERCITSLAKCFLTDEAKFKQLPCKLILHVTTPLFCLYNKVRQSPCLLKKNLQQLLLLILLEEETKREELFSVFLGHNAGFGDHVLTEFGPTGGIKIVGLNKDLNYPELADTVFELVCISKDLAPNLFTYILRFLSNVNKLNRLIENQSMLETEDDTIGRLEMQMSTCMLLQRLADMKAVRIAQAKNPQSLLSFIKFLFTEYTNLGKKQQGLEENECEILYLSLMLIKTMLEEDATLDIDIYRNFDMFLKECLRLNIPAQLESLIKEVVSCIKHYGSSGRKFYQDLSANSTTSSKFDQAVKDLTDPLLPVRANGLITLRKLIETQDSCAIARKSVVLRLLQENLKHEDSYIYLASINGLCALATAYPQEVIDTLMPEYIDMPSRISGTEVTIETRIKLGEILVKTTRALGEMSVVHKNKLVNCFLCAVRDKEPLVRASALSCLGELCKVLNFRLGNILNEIVYCITSIVKHERVPECRRAAVMVAALLFCGLGKDTLVTLRDNLVGLYRGLKYLRDEDNDPVLRLHAQLALEEVDHIVQNYLKDSCKLEKKIFVLDLLS